ncbi:FAD/NAD(P)-binding protein [Streptomyces sp. WMMC500]|uniref:FAD/NAD(P)-binding protein n=1 Tax=Streptomyces sp. WMMC500 TaxID=3015154 RepID=UPI00248BA8D6|nr:FAD/NAD(P)-binding protein [Streptomyces sp. WMMC500]WBB64368.1 FAD/NAD(P)-binding protein [Streptomyces sp. WMMC500]
MAVVGAGAAGALTAMQLCETAIRRSTPLELVLIDPAPEAGRGVAYATTDPRHRLNVPAGGMSCYPDDPTHFVRWLQAHGEPAASACDFVPRHRYGAYLADSLGQAVIRAHGTVAVSRLRTKATACTWTAGGRAALRLADGRTQRADSVVIATGPAPGPRDWAPGTLRGSDRFVPDPWAPGALDALAADAHAGDDVLLVGTGLTAVDMALTLARSGRRVHAVSRGGELPRPHALTALPPLQADPGLPGLPLAELRTAVRRHVAAAVRAHGDWRPAVDGLRPLTQAIWARLSDEDRAGFLARDASRWNVHRHRMPPATAESVQRALAARKLRLHTGRVRDVAAGPDGGLAVTLSGGRTLHVGWVVDCTGPGLRVEECADPLWRGLLADGTATPGPLGIGVATDAGRLRPAAGRAPAVRAGAVDDPAAVPPPLFTLGSARRGELWETTAVPEIRVQAAEVAAAVLEPLREPVRGRRRPTDVNGLPVSTHAAAAAAYRAGLERLLKVRAGAETAFARAVELDPGFALGHAALALIGHECGAEVDVPRALADAQRAARERADERERAFVEVVTRRIAGSGDSGDTALTRHLAAYPGDALALSVAVPTIAFSGVTDLDGAMARRLVERTTSAYEGHWFHTSLLAFMRQDDGRFDEAAELARRALAVEPAAGHAVHALAHVHYETGAHERGRDWLDGWIGDQGRGATHRAHFSWHVALHELALDDPDAVRRRWFAQLAPGRVNGVRALVDSGSLLWRARMSGCWTGEQPVEGVLAAVEREVVERPATPFTAMHGAVALTAAGDLPALRRLRTHAAGADPVQREVVAPLCEALEAVLEERWPDAVARLEAIRPVLRKVGGSAAQREVVEETLLFALVSGGRCEAARRLLETRLDRRDSPADHRRLAALPGLD